MLNLQGLPHSIGDFLADGKNTGQQFGADLETRAGGRVANVTEHDVKGAQRLSGPVPTDLRKHPMLNREIGRASCRERV